MLATFSWFVATLPGLLYVGLYTSYRQMLRQRRDEIEQLIGRGTTLRQQYHAIYGAPTGKLDEAVHVLVYSSFGWRAFALPLVIVSFLSLTGSVVGLVRLGFPSGLPESLITLLMKTPTPLLIGFGGAYTWSVYDMLERYRRADFSPFSLNNVWFRLLLAPPIAALAGVALAQPFDVLAAFGIGAFPAKTLEEFVQGRARKQLGFDAAVKAAGPENLGALQGLTADLIDRFDEESISSTQHLAYTDPIKLLLRTNVEWKIILDMMDQALLYNYVGEKLNALRLLGIRGAIEAVEFFDRLKRAQGESLAELERVLDVIATRLEIDRAGVLNLLQTISDDGQVEFIQALWGESAGVEEAPAA